jgi:hypothetical protein
VSPRSACSFSVIGEFSATPVRAAALFDIVRVFSSGPKPAMIRTSAPWAIASTAVLFPITAMSTLPEIRAAICAALPPLGAATRSSVIP